LIDWCTHIDAHWLLIMRLTAALLRLWHCGLKPKHLPRVYMSAELAPIHDCAADCPLLTRLLCLACDQTALEWAGRTTQRVGARRGRVRARDCTVVFVVVVVVASRAYRSRRAAVCD
jgi:hypothetical protein